MSDGQPIQRALRFRLEPTAEQEQALARFAGARRWAWNWALEQRRAHYAETGKTLGTAPLCRQLTELKRQPEYAWLYEINAQLPQQAIRDLDQAFAAFFSKRAAFPRFKSKKTDRQRLRIPQGVRLSKGRIVLPRLGSIKIRQSRAVVGALGGATCKQDATGHWFVTITETLPVDLPATVSANPERVLGLDRGLKDLIVGSDGSRVAAPRWYRMSERRLRRTNKALSRTQKGSRRHQKARHRLALVHQKTANCRADFLHKLTTRLVQQYDGVCIEDLSTLGLARTKLAKSVLDAAWGEFARQLRYKAEWIGKLVVKTDRWYPSSKTCSACGWRLSELPLSVRVWSCPACGVVQDRDLNAALNIRAEGLRMLAAGHADSRNARRAAVRPGTARHAA